MCRFIPACSNLAAAWLSASPLSRCLPISHFRKVRHHISQVSRNNFTRLCKWCFFRTQIFVIALFYAFPVHPTLWLCRHWRRGRNARGTLPNGPCCIYRDLLKCGPVLLSNSQAGTGRNFSQPRARLLAHLCVDQRQRKRGRERERRRIGGRHSHPIHLSILFHDALLLHPKAHPRWQ